MILTVCSVTAAAGLVYAMFAFRKRTARAFREGKYDLVIQHIGFWAMVDDRLRKKGNKLEELPTKTGEVAVVTGGARGIGYHVVRKLAECGMRVVAGVRNVEAGKKMAEEFRDQGLAGSVDVRLLDVSSVKSVEKFAEAVREEYPKINLLVNNAGIMYGDYEVTEDGFENQLATNYLGHFLLAHRLMPSLRAAGSAGRSARVVNVSSCAHKAAEIFFDDINMKEEYLSSAAYAQSKLAQVMSAKYLDKLMQTQGVNVRFYSVHPGIVNTELFNGTALKTYSRWFVDLCFKTPEEGAISILHACLSPKLEERGGSYISNCKNGSDSNYSRREDMQEKLFKVTCDMLNVKNFSGVETT